MNNYLLFIFSKEWQLSSPPCPCQDWLLPHASPVMFLSRWCSQPKGDNSLRMLLLHHGWAAKGADSLLIITWCFRPKTQLGSFRLFSQREWTLYPFFFLDDGPCGLCLYFISFRSFIVLIFTGKLFYVMTPLGNLNLSVSNLIISALECPPKRTSFVFYLLAYKQIKLTRVVLEDPQEIWVIQCIEHYLSVRYLNSMILTRWILCYM